MKKLLIITMILISGSYVFSQGDEKNDEIRTIFGGPHSHGGYGAITLNYTTLNNMDGIVLGGRGSWIIDHGFAIGLGGSGTFCDYYYDDFLNDDINIAGGYGGIYFEPILLPKFPVHISLPVLVGVGGVAITYGYYDSYDWQYSSVDHDAFMIVEPGVELEFNMMKFFRMAFGAYYRYTSDVQLNYYNGLNITPPDVLHGLSMGMTLKFGSF